MRLPSGKRLGQSGYELALAVFFTFFIHAAVVAAALFISFTAIPKKLIPPVYQVKLVGLPQEPALAPMLPVEPTPAPPPPEPAKKPASQPKAGKHAVKPVKAAPKRNAIPELSSQKPKPTAEQAPPAETTESQVSAKTSIERTVPSSGGEENIVVTTPEQEFNSKFPYYFNAINNRIKQYWKPTPDTKDAKVRVIFTVNRFGRVGDVNIDAEHTNGTDEFQRAAKRAILDSKKFPPLPEEFSKQTIVFIVDLIAE